MVFKKVFLALFFLPLLIFPLACQTPGKNSPVDFSQPSSFTHPTVLEFFAPW